MLQRPISKSRRQSVDARDLQNEERALREENSIGQSMFEEIVGISPACTRYSLVFLQGCSHRLTF